MSRKSAYPANEGWIRMDATLTSSKPLAEEEIKNIVSMGKPEDYEFGPITQHGARLRTVTRHKSRIPAKPGTCRICGCTDLDCSGCLERTGQPCEWADESHTLCSACIEKGGAA